MIHPAADPYNIVVSEEGRDEDREAILRPLRAFNRRHGPPTDNRPLALLVKDAGGIVTGGLWGYSLYDWLFVELLVVPEPFRRTGLGTRLMRQAEEIARQRDCVGIWLDTFEFQARPFYEKLGYSVFGQLDDHPRGVIRYLLQKRIQLP
jgi:GNAT superfamily N-acetyltransferase